MEGGGQVPADREATDRLSYRLKRASSAMRAAMDKTLRSQRMTVPQYATLELLDRHPGLSNAELARDAFVTRQSMNLVLRALVEDGLVARPATAEHGRALPALLTAEGRRRLEAARGAVYALDQRISAAVPADRLGPLLADLDRMVDALGTADDARVQQRPGPEARAGAGHSRRGQAPAPPSTGTIAPVT